MKLKFVGKWAFLVGLAIAVLASFITGYATIIALVLFLLGLIVGFLNISQKDSSKFLLATIALLIGGMASMTALSIFGVVSVYLTVILGNFIAFVSAAALVVAIKSVVETGRN
ncbi:MAG: hypothetical protein PHH00_01095 [Candidatus Nanoarchaeia archaeon]|nr:hypothetical protein [Candidatus Nanoarchaeia archaeon]